MIIYRIERRNVDILTVETKEKTAYIDKSVCVCHFSTVIFKVLLLFVKILNANKRPLFMNVFWFVFLQFWWPFECSNVGGWTATKEHSVETDSQLIEFHLEEN